MNNYKENLHIQIIISKFISFIIFLLITNYSTKKYLNEFQIKNYIRNNRIRNVTKKNYEKELYSIKMYVKQLKERLINIKNYYNIILKPKISFIATVYNKEYYLYPFILSIQNQLIKEFELIFIDDCSSDNSTKIINEFIRKDKRIKLIQNKKNMGPLFGRSIGAIYSKGEYILFVDSDDIILKDGLLKIYNYIKKKDIDMVEFHTIFEKNNSIYVNRRYYRYKNIIYQPILSYIYYYKKNKGREGNTALWDKLVKRQIVLKSLKYIGDKYIKEKIVIENDVVILFALFRNSKSFQYIEEIGYYYICSNGDSITHTRYNPQKSNDIIRSIFINIIFLYEHTDNTYYDKCFVIYKLKQAYKRYKRCFKYINKGMKLIKKVFNLLLYSKYISLNDKLYISKIKYEIIKKI